MRRAALVVAGVALVLVGCDARDGVTDPAEEDVAAPSESVEEAIEPTAEAAENDSLDVAREFAVAICADALEAESTLAARGVVRDAIDTVETELSERELRNLINDECHRDIQALGSGPTVELAEPEGEPYELPDGIDFVFGEGAEHEREPVITTISDVDESFSVRFGISVTDATVLVFDDLDELEAAIVDALGVPANHLNITAEVYAQAFPRLVAIYIGHAAYDGSVADSMLAHEWFHVLQHQLVHPDGQLSGIRLDPRWMAEGNAVYIEVVLSEERGQSGIRDHYVAQCEGEVISLADLEAQDDLAAIQRMEHREYCGGFLATELLVLNSGEKALIDYWRRLGHGEGWREAFAASFGISVGDFYDEFDAHRNR